MMSYVRLLVLLIAVSLGIQGCDDLLNDKSQERVVSPYESVWVNDENICDSITITKQGENFLFARYGKKYPANLENELLNIYSEVESKAILSDLGTLVFQGSEYRRVNSVISSGILAGEFTAYNCDKELRGSIEIDSNQSIQIYAFAYAEVYGKLKPNSNNSYLVFYDAAYGSIAFHEIDGDLMLHVNKDEPIAKIKVLSDDFIQFEWLGIALRNHEEPYFMETLSDNSLWCKPSKSGVQLNVLKRNN